MQGVPEASGSGSGSQDASPAVATTIEVDDSFVDEFAHLGGGDDEDDLVDYS